MANEQNLRPGEYKLTLEEQKKGGIASGKARRDKKNLRLAFEALLEKDYTDKHGNTVTGTEAAVMKIFEKVMKGDVRAFETMRDTVGQKPVEKVMVAEVDQDVIDEVERAVLGE